MCQVGIGTISPLPIDSRFGTPIFCSFSRGRCHCIFYTVTFSREAVIHGDVHKWQGFQLKSCLHSPHSTIQVYQMELIPTKPILDGTDHPNLPITTNTLANRNQALCWWSHFDKTFHLVIFSHFIVKKENYRKYPHNYFFFTISYANMQLDIPVITQCFLNGSPWILTGLEMHLYAWLTWSEPSSYQCLLINLNHVHSPSLRSYRATKKSSKLQWMTCLEMPLQRWDDLVIVLSPQWDIMYW